MTTSPTHPFWPLGLRLDSSVPDDRPPSCPHQILAGPFCLWSLSCDHVAVVRLCCSRPAGDLAETVLVCSMWVHSLEGWFSLYYVDLSETKPYLNFGKSIPRVTANMSWMITAWYAWRPSRLTCEDHSAYGWSLLSISTPPHTHTHTLSWSLWSLWVRYMDMCCFLTEYRNGFQHGELGHSLDFWFYFVFLNALWLALPGLLTLASIKQLAHAQSILVPKPQKLRASRTKEWWIRLKHWVLRNSPPATSAPTGWEDKSNWSVKLRLMGGQQEEKSSEEPLSGGNGTKVQENLWSLCWGQFFKSGNKDLDPKRERKKEMLDDTLEGLEADDEDHRLQKKGSLWNGKNLEEGLVGELAEVPPTNPLTTDHSSLQHAASLPRPWKVHFLLLSLVQFGVLEVTSDSVDSHYYSGPQRITKDKTITFSPNPHLSVKLEVMWVNHETDYPHWQLDACNSFTDKITSSVWIFSYSHFYLFFLILFFWPLHTAQRILVLPLGTETC